MKPERWEQVAQLHRAALEREGNERAAFLGEVCAGDEDLRRELESLLAYEGKDASFLESPALEVAARQLARGEAAARGARRARISPACWARRFPITASWGNWAAAEWGWFIRPRTPSFRVWSP
jgi:hypothetical protein